MTSETAILKSIAGEAMTLEGVAAKGTVNGLLFELSVEQRYRNPSQTNIEAVYTFPLPFGAVLLDLDVELNGKTLTGIVVEKRAAEAQYEDAIAKGDTAIMLERAANGLCTVNLGNLMAGERATIRYRYSQLLRFEQGSVRLTVPTVIAPRYGEPADAGMAPHQAPLSDLLVEYPFALTLLLSGDLAAGAVTSPSHVIAVMTTPDGLEITLKRDNYLDRDFVLTVERLPAQSLVTIGRDGEGYVALASFCADVPRAADELPLRLKMVVDCSGSMNGDSIAAAKRALHKVLERLAPTDRMSLTRFGSHFVHDIDHLQAADAKAVMAAGKFVALMDGDLGGTEMEGALTSVFALGGIEGAADVLLITDGEIWKADSLVAKAQRSRQRVFVVGIGSSPAEGVLRRIAEATGGACEFVAPNEDAEAGILRMFGRLRAPRIQRADIAWPQAPKWVTPMPGGLFGGETIHVYAGFDAPPSGDVELKLVRAGDAQPLTAQARLPVQLAGEAVLARMAAATRIESAAPEERLALALQYSLLTKLTNFIVVHQRAEGENALDLPALRTVAQMHAAGWGGVGSVAAKLDLYYAPAPMSGASPEVAFSMSREPKRAEGFRAPDLGAVKRLLKASFQSLESVPGGYIDQVLRALDRQFRPFMGKRLPLTFDDLIRVGVAPDVMDELKKLVAAGHAEHDVVRAYLEALAERARESKVSRKLVSRLHDQFNTSEECRELRAAVMALNHLRASQPSRVPAH